MFWLAPFVHTHRYSIPSLASSAWQLGVKKTLTPRTFAICCIIPSSCKKSVHIQMICRKLVLLSTVPGSSFSRRVNTYSNWYCLSSLVPKGSAIILWVFLRIPTSLLQHSWLLQYDAVDITQLTLFVFFILYLFQVLSGQCPTQFDCARVQLPCRCELRVHVVYEDTAAAVCFCLSVNPES